MRCEQSEKRDNHTAEYAGRNHTDGGSGAPGEGSWRRPDPAPRDGEQLPHQRHQNAAGSLIIDDLAHRHGLRGPVSSLGLVAQQPHARCPAARAGAGVGRTARFTAARARITREAQKIAYESARTKMAGTHISFSAARASSSSSSTTAQRTPPSL